MPSSKDFTPPSVEVFPSSGPSRFDQLGPTIGPARADPTAQESGGPIGIQNVRRGVMRAVIGPGSNISIPVDAAWQPLSIPLKGGIILSGRPVFLVAHGAFHAGASGNIGLNFRFRGVDLPAPALGQPGGLTSVNMPVPFAVERMLNAPAPGPAEIELVARTQVATGTIWISSALVSLVAVEL